MIGGSVALQVRTSALAAAPLRVQKRDPRLHAPSACTLCSGNTVNE